MSKVALRIGPAILDAALRAPDMPAEGVLSGVGFSARIAFPYYDQRIALWYGNGATLDLDAVGRDSGIPFDFRHFGLICRFERPVELHLYDAEMAVEPALRDIVARIGPLILRNAYPDAAARGRFHRNIFGDRVFHVDRGDDKSNQYSLFCRDPFDPVQKAPRSSSTLFIANIVAYLQSLKEGRNEYLRGPGRRARYELFRDEPVPELAREIVLEQSWDEPEGTGEVCPIDNRTVLHASHHRSRFGKGYPIGAIYLY